MWIATPATCTGMMLCVLFFFGGGLPLLTLSKDWVSVKKVIERSGLQSSVISRPNKSDEG